MNINFRNVSQMNDDYFEQFDVRFHVSEFNGIFTNDQLIKRNMADELNLQFISSLYGDNLTSEGLHPNIKKFVEAIEKEYGEVLYSDIPGFIIQLEVNTQEGLMTYFVAAGNNGQELSTGFYLEHKEMLDSKNVHDIMKELDSRFFELLKSTNISKIA